MRILAVVIAFLGYIFFISSNGYMVLLSWLLAIGLYIYGEIEAKKKTLAALEELAVEVALEELAVEAAYLAAAEAAEAVRVKAAEAAETASPEEIAAAKEVAYAAAYAAAANKLEATAAARAAAKVAAEDALLNRTPTPHPVSQPLPNTVEENSVFKYGDPVSVSDEAALEEAKRMRAMLLMIVGGIALVLILVATLG